MTGDVVPAKPGLAAFAIVGTLVAGINILATVARTKVVAHVLGPEGVGVTAEISQLVSLSMVGSTIAAGPALLRRIAEAERSGDEERVRLSVRAAIGLAATLAFVGAALAVVVGPYVLPRAGEYPSRLYVGLAATATGIGALSAVAQTLFVGRGNLRALAVTTLVPLLLSTVSAILLTLAFALHGQFWAMAVGAVVNFTCALLYLRKLKGRAAISFRPALDWPFVREALMLGATGLIAGYFGQVLFTTIRQTLEVVGGAANGARFNGNYQAAFAIGTTYFTMLFASLGTYFQPRFASASDTNELTRCVREAEGFVLRVAPPVLLIAVAFRADIIRLLYSDRFELAISILGYQLAGDVARGVGTVSATPLLVRGKTRAFLLTEGIGVGIAIVFNVLLIPKLGPQGAGLAYLFTYLAYLPVTAVVLRSSCGVSISARTLVQSIGFTALAVVVDVSTRYSPILRWFLLPLLFIWMWRSGPLKRLVERLRHIIRNAALTVRRRNVKDAEEGGSPFP